MPGKFEKIADDFYDRVYKVFVKTIKKAEKEVKRKKLTPIYAYAYMTKRVNETFEELNDTMDMGQLYNGYLCEEVYSHTDKYLTAAQKELMGIINDLRSSTSLYEMIEKGKKLRELLKDAGLENDEMILDIDFEDDNDIHFKKLPDYDKFIFDMDYTIFIPDWSMEDDYFKTCIPLEEQEEFFKVKQDIIDEYEATYPKYDFKTLSEFFKQKGFTVSEEVIAGWMKHNAETIKDEVVEGVRDLFKYLKANGKTIVILTNWFGEMQKRRLERTGLLEYVDYIVSGDMAMKPSEEAFKLAIGDTSNSNCIMVGDSVRNDLEGAQNVGLDCYLVTKAHTIKMLYGRMMEKEDAESAIITPFSRNLVL